jgi:putative transposase
VRKNRDVTPLDLKRGGLAVAPELAVADGALGFSRAIEEVWPQAGWMG